MLHACFGDGMKEFSEMD